MKKKIVHFDSVHISTNVFNALREHKQLIKVRIGTFFHDELICEFYLPIAALESHGFVSEKIIRARALHDFKITFGHHSGGTIQ